MNILDKKFIEKTKLYDNDKEFIQDKLEYKKSKINISNNSSNFLKKVNNSTKNYFDKIYSDFFLFQNENNNKINNNLIKDNYEESKYFEFENIENSTIKPIKSKNNNKKKKDNSKILFNENKKYYNINIPSNKYSKDVGERLYNDSFLTKTKIDNIRKIRDYDFKKKLIPKITQKAKKMKGDEKRLYNENYIKKMRKINSQKNIHEKDKTCSFKPELNKNSLKIAEKLEPSSSRLSKKKIKINKDQIIDLTKKNYSNLFGNRLFKRQIKINNDNFNNKKMNRSMGDINKRIDDFYQRQLEKIKLKEKIYNENKLKKEEEYQKYPFHPIIKHTNNMNRLNKTHINKTSDTFERLYKSNKSCRKQIYINEIKTNSNELYTFKPEISPLNLKDDQKTIMNNLLQSNSYIQKRRKNLESNKNLENYKNKKMGNIYGLFKPVIVSKDNGLRTERRCNSKGEKNKEDINKYIITKGTIDFNNDLNTNGKQKIFYYLNDENNDMNINIIKYNNIRHDLNQKEFLNAINALHNQIDNLNI